MTKRDTAGCGGRRWEKVCVHRDLRGPRRDGTGRDYQECCPRGRRGYTRRSLFVRGADGRTRSRQAIEKREPPEALKYRRSGGFVFMVRAAQSAPEVTAARTMRAGVAALEDSIAARGAFSNSAGRANVALQRAQISRKAACRGDSAAAAIVRRPCGHRIKGRKRRPGAIGHFRILLVCVSDCPVSNGYRACACA